MGILPTMQSTAISHRKGQQSTESDYQSNEENAANNADVQNDLQIDDNRASSAKTNSKQETTQMMIL